MNRHLTASCEISTSKNVRRFRPFLEVLEDRYAPGSLLSMAFLDEPTELSGSQLTGELKIVTASKKEWAPNSDHERTTELPVTSFGSSDSNTSKEHSFFGPIRSLSATLHNFQMPDSVDLDRTVSINTNQRPFSTSSVLRESASVIPEDREVIRPVERMAASVKESRTFIEDEFNKPESSSEEAADSTGQTHLGIAPLHNSGPRFEMNVGQFDAQVDYLVRGLQGTVFLAGNELVLHQYFGTQQTVHSKGINSSKEVGHVLRMEFVGANSEASYEGVEQLAGITNYFIGSDPSGWHSNVPSFSRVNYDNMYPGIDLEYYGQAHGSLEYDFIVSPGADPSNIRMRYTGAEAVNVNANGELVIDTGPAQVVKSAPFIYQEAPDGSRLQIEGSYHLSDIGDVGFVLGAYDSSLALVIDPVLGYSSYLGGSSIDIAYDLALDSSNNMYITGQTRSTNYPTTSGAYDTSLDRIDVFVTKMNSSGSALVYSTYVGGSDGATGSGDPPDLPGGHERGLGIVVDSEGQAYVTGATASADFPLTNTPPSGAADTHAFLFKLNDDGDDLLYSTTIGRINQGQAGEGIWIEIMQIGNDVAVDSNGVAFVVGHTGGLDTTGDPEADHYHTGDAWLAIADTTTETNAATVH